MAESKEFIKKLPNGKEINFKVVSYKFEDKDKTAIVPKTYQDRVVLDSYIATKDSYYINTTGDKRWYSNASRNKARGRIQERVTQAKFYKYKQSKKDNK